MSASGGSVYSPFRRSAGALVACSAALVLPLTKRSPGPDDLLDGAPPERAEQPAERELGRQDDRQEHDRQDDDDRTGPVQVLGRDRRETLARIAAGAECAPRDLNRLEREAQERADAAKEQRGADHLGAGRLDGATPEVVPADDHQ